MKLSVFVKLSCMYRTLVRPALLYGAETWSTTKKQENTLEVNKMRMLRWMCGVTKEDNNRNEHVRGSVKVVPVTKEIIAKRLKWYGHKEMDSKAENQEIPV